MTCFLETVENIFQQYSRDFSRPSKAGGIEKGTWCELCAQTDQKSHFVYLTISKILSYPANV